jgi:hypothetical protein
MRPVDLRSSRSKVCAKRLPPTPKFPAAASAQVNSATELRYRTPLPLRTMYSANQRNSAYVFIPPFISAGGLFASQIKIVATGTKFVKHSRSDNN